MAIRKPIPDFLIPAARALVEKYALPEPNSGCYLWSGRIDRYGYGMLSLDGRRHLAHRMAWLVTYDEWPDSLVCHRCDMPCCVNPQHLFLGSNYDNSWDSIRKGRKWSKLRPADIPFILQDRRSLEDIADVYGVSDSTIGRVKRRENWTRD